MNEKPDIAQPDFLLDLAHYEWIELVLETEKTAEIFEISPVNDDLLAVIPVLTPVLHLLHYRYPVQLISATDEHWKCWENRSQPYEEKTTILAGIRDANFKIHFIELNAMTMRLIELLQQGERTGEQALLELATEMNYSDHDAILIFGNAILKNLEKEQIIVGSKQITIA